MMHLLGHVSATADRTAEDVSKLSTSVETLNARLADGQRLISDHGKRLKELEKQQRKVCATTEDMSARERRIKRWLVWLLPTSASLAAAYQHGGWQQVADVAGKLAGSK